MHNLLLPVKHKLLINQASALNLSLCSIQGIIIWQGSLREYQDHAESSKTFQRGWCPNYAQKDAERIIPTHTMQSLTGVSTVCIIYTNQNNFTAEPSAQEDTKPKRAEVQLQILLQEGQISLLQEKRLLQRSLIYVRAVRSTRKWTRIRKWSDLSWCIRKTNTVYHSPWHHRLGDLVAGWYECRHFRGSLLFTCTWLTRLESTEELMHPTYLL